MIGREEAQKSRRGAAAIKDELPQKNTENAKEGKELDFNRREPERTEKEPKGKNLSRIARFHAMALQKGKIFLELGDSLLLQRQMEKGADPLPNPRSSAKSAVKFGVFTV